MKRGVLFFLVLSLFILYFIPPASALTESQCKAKGLGICSTTLNYNCQDNAALIQGISGYETYCSSHGCPYTTTLSCTSLTLSPSSGSPSYTVTADVNDAQCKVCDYQGCSGSNCISLIRTGDGTFSAPTLAGTFGYSACPGTVTSTINVQCTPSCQWSSVSACANSASDGCGGTCTRNMDGTSCGTNQVCFNGACITPVCNNECSLGQITCTDGTHYQACGNYDADSCLEFGGTTSSCSSPDICQNGGCVTPAVPCDSPWDSRDGGFLLYPDKNKNRIAALSPSYLSGSAFSINRPVEVANWYCRDVAGGTGYTDYTVSSVASSKPSWVHSFDTAWGFCHDQRYDYFTSIICSCPNNFCEGSCPLPTYPTDKWDRVWCDFTGFNGYPMLIKSGQGGYTDSPTIVSDLPDQPYLVFNENWGTGPLVSGISDNIGFRSGRTINIPTTGQYKFTLATDDGRRVWIDDQEIMQGTDILRQWPGAGGTQTYTTTLTAGNHKVRIDYYEAGGNARIYFNYTLVCSGADSDNDRYTTTLADVGQVCCNGNAQTCLGVDCNDNDAAKYQYLTGYVDSDHDNYGAGASIQICSGSSLPIGYGSVAGDCNDANANINPGKIENTQALCSDALDNNCNSLMDCADSSCSGITRTDGKKCCTSPTQCTTDQACENNVCQVPSKIGNPVCCLTYTECLAAASKNSGNTLAWPQSVDCVRNGITERPECY